MSWLCSVLSSVGGRRGEESSEIKATINKGFACPVWVATAAPCAAGTMREKIWSPNALQCRPDCQRHSPTLDGTSGCVEARVF